jgi:hypothetical protein
MNSTLELECPICLDNIEYSKNCIITECKHTFHASCLIKSIVNDNFDCPCCRYELAELPEPDEDDDDEYEDDADDDEYDEDEEDAEAYILNGMRMLFQRAEGIEIERQEGDPVDIPLKYFVDNLLIQNYTFEDMVKILADDACYKFELDSKSEQLIETMDQLMNNYKEGDELNTPPLQPEKNKNLITNYYQYITPLK